MVRARNSCASARHALILIKRTFTLFTQNIEAILLGSIGRKSQTEWERGERHFFVKGSSRWLFFFCVHNFVLLLAVLSVFKHIMMIDLSNVSKMHFKCSLRFSSARFNPFSSNMPLFQRPRISHIAWWSAVPFILNLFFFVDFVCLSFSLCKIA